MTQKQSNSRIWQYIAIISCTVVTIFIFSVLKIDINDITSDTSVFIAFIGLLIAVYQVLSGKADTKEARVEKYIEHELTEVKLFVNSRCDEIDKDIKILLETVSNLKLKLEVHENKFGHDNLISYTIELAMKIAETRAIVLGLSRLSDITPQKVSSMITNDSELISNLIQDEQTNH